jgi:hypothetical protein
MRNVQRKLIGFNLSSKFYYSILIACSLQLAAGNILFAQDNSPYSRYGLGDLHPGNHIYFRGMGGISAALSDQPVTGLNDPRIGKYYPTINFVNPASYSRFYAIKEARTKKLTYGRMLLDVGVNLETHKLLENNNPQSFASSNAYFSYLHVGLPIRKDWGLVFGLRPLSTISYKIDRRERLFNQNNQAIDSALTRFTGDGGAYLFTTGTGFAVKNFSFGINAGYLFGKKDYTTRRTLLNDSVAYASSNHQTRSVFGGMYFNAGMQYRIDLSANKMKYLQLGVYGSNEQTMRTRNDIIRETFNIDPSTGAFFRVDSVSENLEQKGRLNYPATFGGGFIFEQLPQVKKAGWLIGVDFSASAWDNYLFNGQKDAVSNNWTLRIGGQLRPAVSESYKSLLAYRAGVFFGDDYVNLSGQKLPVLGITGGISLPIANLKDASRRFRTQYSIVNISAEYIKRGKKDNPIYENQFRLSVGFTLSDLWFTKRKYD